MIGHTWGKIKETVSGWEKSHFGGYNRMIMDYPYIRLDYSVEIDLDKKLGVELGHYSGEKLIKLYLVKMKNAGLLKSLTSTTEIKTVTNPFTGKETKYELISLNNPSILKAVAKSSGEYQPLFQHFSGGILGTSLLKKIEDEQEGEGEGSGEGDEKNDSETLNETKSLSKVLEELKEQETWKADSLCGFSGNVNFMPVNHRNFTTEHKFSTQEIKDAELLLKMLDISFEPKSDIVKSLRAGKLDVCKIAEVPAGSTSIYKQIVEDQDTKPFGVCILADLSGSMCGGSNLRMQFHTLNVLYLALSQILPPDKLWIYAHTGDEEADVYPFYTPYETNYPINIKNYDSIDYQQNYDGPVIEALHKKVRESSDDRIIFISLSDGSPSGIDYGGRNDIDDMKKILERARRDEFVTVGIGMNYIGVRDMYTHSVIVNDLKNLAKDVSQIVNQVVRIEFK